MKQLNSKRCAALVVVFCMSLCLSVSAQRPDMDLPFQPIPRQTREGVQIWIGYLHQPQAQQEIQSLNDGSLLYPGDLYGIRFSAEKTCYIYIFEHDASGQIVQVFPEGGVENPAQGEKIYHVPMQGKQFKQATPPLVRHIYVLASLQPNMDVEEFYQMMASAKERGNTFRAQQYQAELLRTIESDQISRVAPVIHTGWADSRSFRSPMMDRQIVQVLSMPLSASPSSGVRSLLSKGVLNVDEISEEQLEDLPTGTLLNLFADLSDTIQPESYPLLYEYGKVLQNALPDAVLMIAAHTDDRGSKAEKLDMAQRRAEALKSFLTSHFEIAPARLLIKAYGDNKPMVSNETTEGRRLNNRIELIRLK